jgi:hypothetical protein
MRRKRIASHSAALAVFLLLLSVARSEETTPRVVVTDEAGRPIQRASVQAVSLSRNYEKEQTRADGSVVLRRFYLQPAKWLSVQKSGYEEVYQDYPAKWPHTVSMRRLRTTRPASRPATTRLQTIR